MKTRVAIGQFVATDIALNLEFTSKPVILDDLLALVTFAKETLEAVQDEIAKQFDGEVELLSEVEINHGSIKMKLKLIASKWAPSLRDQVAGLVFSVVLSAFPGAAIHPAQPMPVQPSAACVAVAKFALHNANEKWQNHRKDYRSKLEVTCGGVKVTYMISYSPSQE